MALPTKIPSTFRRTPIVKRQNPALYSTSATQLDSESAFNNSSSFGTLNNYILRYRSSLSVVARLLSLRTDVGFFVVREEYDRLSARSDKTPRETQIAGLASCKITDAENYRQLIIDTVTTLARRDSIKTRSHVSEVNLNESLKVELLQVINEVSTSTSGVER